MYYLTTLSVTRLYRINNWMINEYTTIGEMIIGRETEILREPLLQYDLTWDQTQAAMVGS